jgi:hypothetical protein
VAHGFRLLFAPALRIDVLLGLMDGRRFPSVTNAYLLAFFNVRGVRDRGVHADVLVDNLPASP